MTMEPNELVINVDANGVYVVRGTPMTVEALEELVSKAVADNPIHQVVVIRSDRSTAVQSVVTIMDLCTKLKVPSYKISTDAPPAS